MRKRVLGERALLLPLVQGKKEKIASAKEIEPQKL